jgi:methylmalonyl-CoA mutase
MSEDFFVIPPQSRYLSEIAESNKYDETALSQQQVAQKKLYGIFKTIESVSGMFLLLLKSKN